MGRERRHTVPDRSSMGAQETHSRRQRDEVRPFQSFYDPGRSESRSTKDRPPEEDRGEEIREKGNRQMTQVSQEQYDKMTETERARLWAKNSPPPIASVQRVEITDLHIPFGSMIWLAIKAAIIAIPMIIGFG